SEHPHAGRPLARGAPLKEPLPEGVVHRAAAPELTRGASAPHHHPAEQIGDTLAAPERLTGREVGGNLEDAHDAPRSRIDLAHMPAVVRLLGEKVRDVDEPGICDGERTRLGPGQGDVPQDVQVCVEHDERAGAFAADVELAAGGDDRIWRAPEAEDRAPGGRAVETEPEYRV